PTPSAIPIRSPSASTPSAPVSWTTPKSRQPSKKCSASSRPTSSGSSSCCARFIPRQPTTATSEKWMTWTASLGKKRTKWLHSKGLRN
ncbi:uncharacterized protein METZ01_LOCUS319167, partial [marine metagenome]